MPGPSDDYSFHSSTHATPMSMGSSSAVSSNFVARFCHRFKLRLDKDWSYRQKKLFILEKFLDNSIYDNLSPFHMEFSGSDASSSYIKLANRRPSVMYNMCEIIVDDSTSMLFGDDHFPTVRCGDFEKTSQFLQYITRTCGLFSVMLSASRIGSVGSVCIAIKVLEEKFFFEALETRTLTPYFMKMNPDCLERVIEKVKVDGWTLASYGYNIEKKDLAEFFYSVREWTDSQEIFYLPYTCEKEEQVGFKPTIDKEKTITHNLGLVPLVWIKNLPSAQGIDGKCTFESIVDINIEINYQLSQLGRLIKYNADPTLVIKNPASLEGQQLMAGIGVINVDEKGDAYYAEISGKAAEPGLSYVTKLREYALEVGRGNRVNPEKISSVQSGKAIQMLNSALVSLVSEMRITYGDNGLLEIYKKILDIFNSGKIKIDAGEELPDSNKNCKDQLYLDWPDWYPMSSQEKLQEAQTLATYKETNLLSTNTAVESIADEYGILDIEKEIKDIESEKEIQYNQSLESSMASNNKKLNGVQ